MESIRNKLGWGSGATTSRPTAPDGFVDITDVSRMTALVGKSRKEGR